MHSQANHLRERSRMALRLAGVFAAVAIALLITAAGAEGPLAQESADDGGKLILTGMDALIEIEGSSFVKDTLGLSVQSDVGDPTANTTFEGSSGTEFAGESYAFDSSTAYAPFHDKVEPDPAAAGSAAVIQGVYPDPAAIPAATLSSVGSSGGKAVTA